ncbi:MAG TPA: hypothetical protein VFV38_34215 [Ktedonobacteraceae bacterium]|nr:hypothetical protein [Ktedonobacteraceae bacterium]
MLMQVLFDLEDFFLWLASFSPDELVGQPGRYFHSPLALFLSEKVGHVMGEDGRRYGCAIVDPCFWYELPRWAQMFASLAERSHCSALLAYDAVGLLVEVETWFAPMLAA